MAPFSPRSPLSPFGPWLPSFPGEPGRPIGPALPIKITVIYLVNYGLFNVYTGVMPKAPFSTTQGTKITYVEDKTMVCFPNIIIDRPFSY